MKTILRITKFVLFIAVAASVVAFIAERIEEAKNKEAMYLRKSTGLYERFVKRPLDCFISIMAIFVLSPLLLCLTVIGSIKMKGNPFFTQYRPGRIDPTTGKERIFKLIKFRSMTNEKDKNGKFLPDELRLGTYGKALRSSSLDELPELINIIKGDMALVGPRPQLVRDMVFMSHEQRKRHEVRQGLTGWAQCNGRNGLSWDKKLRYDIDYLEGGITFTKDTKIILQTLKKVFQKDGITQGNMATVSDYGDYLLGEGKICQEEYDRKQKEAKIISNE